MWVTRKLVKIYKFLYKKIARNLTDLIANKLVSPNGIDLIIIGGDIAYDDGM